MKKLLLALALVALSSTARASCTVPNTFVNGTVADANAVNANFAAMAACINAQTYPTTMSTSKVLGNFTGVSGPPSPVIPPDGLRSKLINGEMRVDQINGGAAENGIGAFGIYIIDRWQVNASQSGQFNGGQNFGAVVPPPGFSNYLGFTVASSFTPGLTDYFGVDQPLEGLMMTDLGFGTAAAQSFGLSFWTYSTSITGTFGGSFCNYAGTRCYAFTYTIPNANTWTYNEVIIPGDSSGVWVGASNAGAAFLNFGLGAGATQEITAGAWQTTGGPNGTAFPQPSATVNPVSTGGESWYLTGVQLEAGGIISAFEHRPFSIDLFQSQRYYQCSYDYGTVAGTATTIGTVSMYLSPLVSATYSGQASVTFGTSMRGPPSLTVYSVATGAAGKIRDISNGVDVAAGASETGRNGFVQTATMSGASTALRMQFQWCVAAQL